MAAHSLVDEHPSLINKKLKREIVKEVKQLGFSANAALIAGKLEGEMTASHASLLSLHGSISLSYVFRAKVKLAVVFSF